jgi:hypothetical protein
MAGMVMRYPLEHLVNGGKTGGKKHPVAECIGMIRRDIREMLRRDTQERGMQN